MGTIGLNMGPDAVASTTLFGRVRLAILTLLFSRPDDEFYFKEIVRSTDVGVGAAQRELSNLARGGIVQRRSRGNNVFFRANHESPIYEELHSLILKTSGVVEVLRESLEPVATAIQFACVFGSTARRRVRSSSDIDLLVVGKASFADVVANVQEAQERLAREVNPVVYSPIEFRRKMREDSRFLNSIVDNQLLFVIGNEREFRSLARKRLAGASSNKR